MGFSNDYANPWATGTGANVLTAAQLAALAARTTGFTQGLASSQQANTVWRQVSVAVAALTQLAADYGPSNVVDDGNVTNLENQILAAIRAITTSSPAISIPYEGVDTGVTANAVFVSVTQPQVTTIAAGQIYIVTKSALTNISGGVTFKQGSNAPVNVQWPDGTPLNGGDWPGFGTAWLYIVSQAGNLIAQFMTAPRLNFPGLAEQDVPANNDLFAYYDQSAAMHTKIPFSTLAAAILAAAPKTLVNPQVFHLEEQRSAGTAPRVPTVNTWMVRILNTTVANQMTGASLDPSTGNITLPAGGYRVWFAGMAHNAGLFKARLWNVTGNTLLSGGTSNDSHVNSTGTNTATTNPSVGASRFVLTQTSVIQLQQNSFVNTDGGTSLGTMGDDSTGYDTFTDAYVHLERENGT